MSDDFEVVPLVEAPDRSPRRRASDPGATPRPLSRVASAPPPGPSWFRIAAVLLGLAAIIGGAAGAGWVLLSRPRAYTPGKTLDAGRRPVPEPQGPLAGLVVYVSAGHGYLLHRRHHDGPPLKWGLQRQAWYGIIEDLYTAAFVADQLAPKLEAAGATVVALRERDRHGEAWVVDDGDRSADASFTAVGWQGVVYDDLATGGAASRIAAGGIATWTVTVPETGHWYLYTRWVEADDQDAQAIYTVVAGDVVSEVVVDQRAHGGHWVKLLNASLPEGTPIDITLSGSGGAPMSADAVRLGGGTLLWAPEPEYVLRQHPNFDVSFAHQHDHLGGPEAIGIYPCGNPRSDMRLRPNWVSWASPEGEEALFLSIHTNGGRGEGAMVFAGIDSTPPTPPRPGSEALAAEVEQHMVAAGRTIDPTYATDGWRHGDYSEISPLHNSLPAALVELAFHDHPKDAARLRDPRMQAALAEGIVQGVVAWRAAGGEQATPRTPRSSD